MRLLKIVAHIEYLQIYRLHCLLIQCLLKNYYSHFCRYMKILRHAMHAYQMGQIVAIPEDIGLGELLIRDATYAPSIGPKLKPREPRPPIA